MLTKKIRYELDDVLSQIRPFTPRKKSRVDFDGDIVPMNSFRYLMFAIKGVTCVSCGITADHFKKVWGNQEDNPHFTPFATDAEGNEIMLTRDHIIPRSWGGKNDVQNTEPMCSPCNHQKDDELEEELILQLEKQYGKPLENITVEEAERVIYPIKNSPEVYQQLKKWETN